MSHAGSYAPTRASALKPELHWFAAPAAAAVYPFVLMACHSASTAIVQGAGWAAWLAAAGTLLLALAMPVLALLLSMRLGRIAAPTRAELLARRVALLAVATPPMFTLTGVIFLLLGRPAWDVGFMVVLWLGLAAWIGSADRREPALKAPPRSHTNWRTAHGVAAVLALVFIAFHFSNHLVGLVGPEAHLAVMKVLRVVYRSALIEPLLIGCFAFLIGSGAFMAWRLTARPADAIRTLQVAGGVFLIFAIVSHVNAVLYLARVHFGIDTDWGFAVGAPTGMLKDAWNIRLLPYYMLAVFFLIAHAFCGLRVVMLAHRYSQVAANRVLAGGLVLAGIVATVIILAMCGMRIQFV